MPASGHPGSSTTRSSPPAERYHLYYTVVNTTFEGGGSAIGAATAASPLGPWTHRGVPVIEPHPADCCPGSRRAVFDPDVVRTAGPDYIYYGQILRWGLRAVPLGGRLHLDPDR
jgi:hypothetical protein